MVSYIMSALVLLPFLTVLCPLLYMNQVPEKLNLFDFFIRTQNYTIAG
jgi:hypothetical protein